MTGPVNIAGSVGSGVGSTDFADGTGGLTAVQDGGTSPLLMVDAGPAAGSDPLAEAGTPGQATEIIDPALIHNGSTGSSLFDGVLQGTSLEQVQSGVNALVNGVDSEELASHNPSQLAQPPGKPHPQGLDIFDQVFSSLDQVDGLSIHMP
jgi:hypothetical protein